MSEAKVPAVMVEFRQELAKMAPEFKAALPPHIPVARFVRVVQTAIQNKPQLLRCDRRSLFNACMRAAQDGLLPDGRQGAIVNFGDNDETGVAKSDQASWMVMVEGLRIKARNSGALKDWNVQVVYEGDQFEHEKGDEPFIRHIPAKTGGRMRKVTHAYSIATYKDDTKSREVMNIDEIEDIRKKYSKAKKGPWSDPVAYPEMCKKTVAHLHAKQLPSSTDLDAILQRDHALYDFESAKHEAKQIQRPGSAAETLQYFASGGDHDGDGVVIDQPPEETKKQEQVTHEKQGPQEKQAPTNDLTQPPPVMPKNEEEYRIYARATVDAANDAVMLRTWFGSDAQQRMRKAAGVTRELFDIVKGWVDAKCRELEQGKAA